MGSRINLRRLEYRRVRAERFLNLLIGLTAMFLAMGLVWGLSMRIAGTQMETQRLALQLSLRQLNQEIRVLEPQIDEAQGEVTALSNGSLPNLIPLRTGEAIAMETGFASNITYNWAETENGRRLQYRLVAHNTSKSAVYLRLDLLFFDRKGMQIGISRIGDTGTGKLTILERGDLQVVSAPIEITARDAGAGDIRYFRPQPPE